MRDRTMLDRKDEPAKRAKEEIILPFVSERPKIEDIRKIGREAREVLGNAIQDYMTEMDCAKEPTENAKNQLDYVTKMIGIDPLVVERITIICKNVNMPYKNWAASGVRSLTRRREAVREMHSGMLHRIAKRSRTVDDRLRGRLLDFGCGTGWFTEVLRRRFHCKAVGADIDGGATELGRLFGVKGLLAIDANEKKIPFETGHFDAVVLKDVLNAPYTGKWDEEEILAEASRLTKDGGLLLLSEDGTCGMAATLRPYGFELVTKEPIDEPVWSAWVKLEELIGKRGRE
jgi:2-polyprenyl-3-methyl-5-hydroxy-6-metoxy-1,4-benzoquinol methylase